MLSRPYLDGGWRLMIFLNNSYGRIENSARFRFQLTVSANLWR
jgi:hypothetical protein